VVEVVVQQEILELVIQVDLVEEVDTHQMLAVLVTHQVQHQVKVMMVELVMELHLILEAGVVEVLMLKLVQHLLALRGASGGAGGAWNSKFNNRFI
jgi:hypothetical protein